MRFSFVSILSWLLMFSTVFSQIGKWEVYTNQQNINQITISEEGIWGATTGGVFFYSFFNEEYKTFTLVDGLKDINITAIVTDSDGKIWIGSQKGYIQVFNPKNNEWKTIVTIAQSNKTKKQINALISKENLIYVCSDFGVSIINSQNYSFGDTYTKLGSFGSDTKVINLLSLDSLWVATEKGLAVQKFGLSNYLDPNSWNNFTTINGLPSNYVNDIIKFNDTIYVATENGLAYFDGTRFWTFIHPLLNRAIKNLYGKGDSLLILTEKSLFLLQNGVVTEILNINHLSFRQIKIKDKIFIASNNGILKLIYPDGGMEYIYPNGPNSNLFPSIAVDEKGNLWAASGRDVVLKGFYKLSSDGWKNFTVSQYPEMGFDAYHNIKITSDNTVWALSWGRGVLRIKNDSDMVRFSSHNVQGMTGIPGAPDFVVIKSLAEDSKGNIWMLNYRVADNNVLIKFSPDSVWTFYRNEINPNLVVVEDIVIDKNDTKWILLEKSGQYQQTEGIIYFNEQGKLASTWGIVPRDKFTGSPLCIAVDQRNEIWVGTSQGVNIITNPLQPTDKIVNVYALRTQYINCITVDGLNNKWVGTQTGVWVLSPDGTQLLAQYNVQNSPLPDNNVKSIAIDHRTGKVYFGTDYGLSSLYTYSVKPKEEFSKLRIYPNPFYLSYEGENTLVIEGLVKNSNIKIFSISGNLINEIKTPGGGIATWNGRDKDLNFVQTGIYYIVAFSEDGEQVATSKVAVISR